MSTAVKLQEVRIKEISVTKDTITAYLIDGRIISVPLAWSWRLSEATPKERANYEIIGDGQGVHWPDIDEDISAVGRQASFPICLSLRSGSPPYLVSCRPFLLHGWMSLPHLSLPEQAFYCQGRQERSVEKTVNFPLNAFTDKACPDENQEKSSFRIM